MINSKPGRIDFIKLDSPRFYSNMKEALTKRIGYVAGILFIALCLFASAYGERSPQTPKSAAMISQQDEALVIEAQIDQLADRMSRLKSDMAVVKLELMRPGKVSRRDIRAR